MDPGDTCSPVGSGTLEKLDALNFTFTVVVLGLCDGFLGSCSILVTQDKEIRSDPKMDKMGWTHELASHLCWDVCKGWEQYAF